MAFPGATRALPVGLPWQYSFFDTRPQWTTDEYIGFDNYWLREVHRKLTAKFGFYPSLDSDSLGNLNKYNYSNIYK